MTACPTGGISLKPHEQMSASLPLYLILSLSGGCMDAYSYLFRDHVFANAQTGNMLLFGVYLAQGDYPDALKYLWPILAFAVGIVLSDLIRGILKQPRLHWRQIALLIEIVILFLASLLPQSHNAVSNALISLACGLQVESFRAVRGNSIATTMCIGNLRSGLNHLTAFFLTHRRERLGKAMIYFGIIFAFILGAVIESVLIRHFAQRALYLSVGTLIIAFALMFRRSEEPETIS